MLKHIKTLDIEILLDWKAELEVSFSNMGYYWLTLSSLPRLVLLNPFYKGKTPTPHNCTFQFDERIPPDSIYEVLEGNDCYFVCRVSVEDIPLSMLL